jgi:hypothetical protein
MEFLSKKPTNPAKQAKTGKNRLFRDEVALNAKWRIESFESVSVDD